MSLLVLCVLDVVFIFLNSNLATCIVSTSLLVILSCCRDKMYVLFYLNLIYNPL